jgi:hypothetical protein
MDRILPAHRSARAPSTSLLAGALTVLLAGALSAVAPSQAAADGPGKGAPWGVSLGDSYIAGEAGRWAGNTDKEFTAVDALGPTAYFDNAEHTAELIPGCHRSRSAEVYIGGGVNGENLACGGARTSSYTVAGKFKPGIDFYNSGGHEGQALMLQHFAASNNVKLVVVSIGGNNFNFGGIVHSCVQDYLTSPESSPVYCSHEKVNVETFEEKNVKTQGAAIKGAYLNVAEAMKKAGYASAQYTILVQDAPSPIPKGPEIRYPQSEPGDEKVRQAVGGCGVWNEDATWANTKALATIGETQFKAAAATGLANIATMDLSAALNGRRLCEKGVGLLEEEGLKSWEQAGAVDKTEWINQIHIKVAPPYDNAESLHPNYWAQLALRNCLTQAYNAGSPKGGVCAISGAGLNAAGEPNMKLK